MARDDTRHRGAANILNPPANPNDREGQRAWRRDVGLNIVRAAIASVEPAAAVRSHLRRSGDILEIDGRPYDLAAYQNIYVVGGGKGSGPMALAIEAILGDRLTSGLICVKYGYAVPTRIVEVEQAGHPIPDDRGARAAERIIALVQAAGPTDLVIGLISGGASALLVAPTPGITLADKRRLINSLLRSGATINEMNVVRKHLSRIKGGGLARLASPATLVNLILSDVLGDPLDVIGSGPTVPDRSTFADAWEVIERFDLTAELPASIASHLREGLAGTIAETPKSGDPAFERTQNVVVASNARAARAAVEQARSDGLNAMLLSTYVEGEAREVARVFAAIAREVAESNNPIARPCAIVAGGETTVTIRGQGRGGRNQEFALAAAIHLSGIDGVTIMAFGTDGSDGPTTAAGAIVDGSTVERARASGIDPRHALADNDSHTFFQTVGELIVTGPTNTNVDDIYVIIAG